MKRLIPLFFIFLLIISLNASCAKKKSDEVSLSGTISGTFTATLTKPTGTYTKPTGTSTLPTGTGTTSTGTGTTSTGTGTTSTSTGTISNTNTGTGTTTLGMGDYYWLDEMAMLTQINNRRANNGVGPVTFSNQIKAVTEEYAYLLIDKSANQYYPSKDGTTIEERLLEGNVTFTEAGETGCSKSFTSYPWADRPSTAINYLQDQAMLIDPRWNKVGIIGAVFRWSC